MSSTTCQRAGLATVLSRKGGKEGERDAKEYRSRFYPDYHLQMEKIFRVLPRYLREWVDRQNGAGVFRDLDIELAFNAQKLVITLGTPKSILKWSQLSYEERYREVPDLSRGITGEVFRRLVDLAKKHAFLTQYYGRYIY